MDRVYLTVADVEVLHQMILEHSGGSSGLRDRGGLESAVFRPQSGYYADIVEEAAALIESLTMNHPFVDGNKRTAVAAAEVFLDYNGFSLQVEANEAFEFMMGNLKQNTFRFPVILEWVRQRVKPQPKKSQP